MQDETGKVTDHLLRILTPRPEDIFEIHPFREMPPDFDLNILKAILIYGLDVLEQHFGKDHFASSHRISVRVESKVSLVSLRQEPKYYRDQRLLKPIPSDPNEKLNYYLIVLESHGILRRRSEETKDYQLGLTSFASDWGRGVYADLIQLRKTYGLSVIGLEEVA